MNQVLAIIAGPMETLWFHQLASFGFGAQFIRYRKLFFEVETFSVQSHQVNDKASMEMGTSKQQFNTKKNARLKSNSCTIIPR